MASVITANNRASRDSKAPAPELKDDGTGYPYRMFFNGGAEIVDADTLEECIECLIPNYTQMTEEAKFDARIEYSMGIQQHLRVNILANLSPGQVEDWELRILAGEYGNEHIVEDPYGWGDGSKEPNQEVDEENIDFWNSKIPLVLIETNYLPYTNIPKPLSNEGDYEYVSNIIWLKPADELSFLRSLSIANVIRFGSPRETRLAN